MIWYRFWISPTGVHRGHHARAGRRGKVVWHTPKQGRVVDPDTIGPSEFSQSEEARDADA